MNPNLDCPGVPNRYSFTPASMATEPKSIATVVVVFVECWPGMSIPTATSVISASVVSGAMSEMAPTVVVLPTPKPPAMTIFTGSGGFEPGADAVRSDDGTESTDHSQDEFGRVGGAHVVVVDIEVAGGPQVTHQDLDHTQMK